MSISRPDRSSKWNVVALRRVSAIIRLDAHVGFVVFGRSKCVWIVTKFFHPIIQHCCLDHCENQLFHCCNVAFGLAANRRKIIGGMSQRISCVTPKIPDGLKGLSFFCQAVAR